MSRAPAQTTTPGTAPRERGALLRGRGMALRRPRTRAEDTPPGDPAQAPRRRRALRRTLARVPAAAWMCALVALLNAVAWSVITPPFQGKDEVDHFAYVVQIVENGALPTNGHEEGSYSPAETRVLEGIHYYEVRFTPPAHAITNDAEQRRLNADDHAGASRLGTGEAGIATSQPPLYYALQAIPYLLARGNILEQLQLMRLLSALLGALTVLFVFGFLREAVPRAPWAANVAALCVALQPLFGFMSGSLNPDTLLFTVSAATFMCLARAFRRGLTRRLAATLGLLVLAGLLTKLNFVGFVPGVLLALVVLGIREARAHGRQALPALTIAAAVAVVPVGLYVLRNKLSGRPTLGAISGPINQLGEKSLWNELSYTWQMFLPRLPGMPHYFRGIATFKDIWFDRSVGLYGWMDTMFPSWVDSVALVLACGTTLLCARELVRQRETVRERLPELGVYAALLLGVIAMLGLASYQSDAISHKDALGEPRYLLPLLPLLAAALALAVRGAGRRWAPVVGAALVMLFIGHDLFSQLQVIARYYG